MKRALIIALGFSASAAQAQVMVPPIDKTALVVPIMATAPTRIELNDKEQAALDIVRKWRSNPDKPRRAEDGTVVYLYGATEPTLICTPLRVCAIRLQAGEAVNDVYVGDSARWEITPARIGNGPNAVTNAIVKAREAGVTTNLIITTDRRSYSIVLKSANHESMPAIAFDYPDEQRRAWENYKAQQTRATQAATLPTGENTAALDFGFSMSGDSPKWKPQRVYRSAEGKTYIQFASDKFLNDAPALVVIGKGGSLWSGPNTRIINHRIVGDRYVVDGIPDKMALIHGVGSEQVRVDIDYTGGKQQ